MSVRSEHRLLVLLRDPAAAEHHPEGIGLDPGHPGESLPTVLVLVARDPTSG